MKTGMELLKEFRGMAVLEGKRETEYGNGQSGGFRCCADELEAWLREADQGLEHFSNDIGESYVARIRSKLLGTTQEGK